MKKYIILFFVSSIAMKGYCQSADENTIKQLLEKESATWRSGDIKAHADCWAIKPYSKIVFSATDGSFYDVPPSGMITPPADMVGKGGSSVNTNYNMNISGNNAWVTHNEESTAKDGTKTFTFELRILEKINSEWKLVAESIHAYKPK